MKQKLRTIGFSLAELILSMGFFAMVILTLIGLGIAITRTDSKALESSAGGLIADQVLERTVAELKRNDPEGVREDFFSGNFSAAPWSSGELTNDRTVFYYEVFGTTVLSTGTGNPLADGLDKNRLKKVDVHVWWAGEDTQSRQGSGRLEVWSTRLISEAEVQSTDEEE